MNTQSYLLQYHRLKSWLAEDRNALERLKASMTDTVAPTVSKDPVQVSPRNEASYVRILEKIEYLSAKIRLEEDLLWDLKAQMLQMFDILPPQKNDLMIARYISGMKWEDIFGEKHLTKPTALRWHREILSQITLPRDAVNIDLELEKLKKVS